MLSSVTLYCHYGHDDCHDLRLRTSSLYVHKISLAAIVKIVNSVKIIKHCQTLFKLLNLSKKKSITVKTVQIVKI